jgi:hypothetical protein
MLLSGRETDGSRDLVLDGESEDDGNRPASAFTKRRFENCIWRRRRCAPASICDWRRSGPLLMRSIR